MKTFIDWQKIDTKGKSSGTIKVRCPECSDRRTDKKDRCLSVNLSDGVAKCHYCNAVSVRDTVKRDTEKRYTLPVQTWQNYTNISDKLVKWFEGRGIKQYVLKDMNITEELYFQSKSFKEVNNVVFNYFEGETLVNKKYRSATKEFSQSKNGKPIFYNINSVIGEETVYIVEGEMDCLSLIQIGIKNVVSVPAGANDSDAYWINSEPYLKDCKKYYIGVDNDPKGNEFAEKIAQRLGRYRCERINWVMKDANEDLINGHLERSVYNTSRYPVGGTFTASDLAEAMDGFYMNGLPPTLTIKNPHFKRSNDIYKEMFGQLVTVTGIPSHGKSTLAEWRVINYLLENDYKASFFSPEHTPMALHMSTFAQKVIGKNFWRDVNGVPRISKSEIDQFVKWADEKLYLTSPENGKAADWDWLIEKFTEQMFAYGVNIFVVDAVNKVHLGKSINRKDMIDETLTRLTNFAQMYNVLLILIAHPTKMNKDGAVKIPDLYDVSGSADFRNQTHCGYAVHRMFQDGDDWTVFKNLKTKYAFQGQIGSEVEFRFNPINGRFHDKFMPPQNENLLGERKTALQANFKFENDVPVDEVIWNNEPMDDLPF